jgi:hypothetical protein
MDASLDRCAYDLTMRRYGPYPEDSPEYLEAAAEAAAARSIWTHVCDLRSPKVGFKWGWGGSLKTLV